MQIRLLPCFLALVLWLCGCGGSGPSSSSMDEELSRQLRREQQRNIELQKAVEVQQKTNSTANGALIIVGGSLAVVIGIALFGRSGGGR